MNRTSLTDTLFDSFLCVTVHRDWNVCVKKQQKSATHDTTDKIQI
jgi:hypothetical protein